MSKLFDIVVAIAGKSRGIGVKNGLPWSTIKCDMNRFAALTNGRSINMQNAIIMGRKTLESMNNKPLLNRYNVVLSSQWEYYNKQNTITNLQYTSSLNDALKLCENNPKIDNVYVIGGSQIYNEAIQHPRCYRIYQTIIPDELCLDKCDVFFPNIPNKFNLVETEYDNHTEIDYDSYSDYTNKQNYKIIFETYKNDLYKSLYIHNSGEFSYINCLNRVLNNGEEINDRTGVGTISIFDENMQFTIETVINDGKTNYRVPMLTTKRLFAKGVILELLWFLSGNTDSNWLSDRGVNIWKGNTSKDFLKLSKLDYNPGEIGAGYGFQWIHWGAKWKSGLNYTEYNNKGINQIENIINTLKTNPTSRRMILSAWNVSDLDKMVLPPCHLMYMFKVERGKLCCKVILRSNDLFLGAPFNILSASILTILIAKAANMQPGKVAFSINDAHIYKNHIEQVKLQIKRAPFQFPLMTINKDINSYEDMLDLKLTDFNILDYKCWPKITGDMAV